MIQEPFAQGPSPIHRSYPGVRIVLAAIFSFSVALMHCFDALILALLFSLALAFLARLPARPLLKRLGAAGAVLLLIWLLVPLTHGGDPMARVGILTVSRSGAVLCLQITLKAFTILLVFISLVATMSIATLQSKIAVSRSSPLVATRKSIISSEASWAAVSRSGSSPIEM